MSLHHLIKDAALDPYLVMRLHMDPEAVAKALLDWL